MVCQNKIIPRYHPQNLLKNQQSKQNYQIFYCCQQFKLQIQSGLRQINLYHLVLNEELPAMP